MLGRSRKLEKEKYGYWGHYFLVYEFCEPGLLQSWKARSKPRPDALPAMLAHASSSFTLPLQIFTNTVRELYAKGKRQHHQHQSLDPFLDHAPILATLRLLAAAMQPNYK